MFTHKNPPARPSMTIELQTAGINGKLGRWSGSTCAIYARDTALKTEGKMTGTALRPPDGGTGAN